MQFKITTIVILTAVVILVFGSRAFNEPGVPEAENAWLAQLLGEEVVCVFSDPIPLLGPTIKAKLKYCSIAGIVLEWNEEDTFYPFSNII
ncbi:MAG: hypothetical protein ABIK28_04655 [Planctomycetota bacterium]